MNYSGDNKSPEVRAGDVVRANPQMADGTVPFGATEVIGEVIASNEAQDWADYEVIIRAAYWCFSNSTGNNVVFADGRFVTATLPSPVFLVGVR